MAGRSENAPTIPGRWGSPSPRPSSFASTSPTRNTLGSVLNHVLAPTASARRSCNNWNYRRCSRLWSAAAEEHLAGSASLMIGKIKRLILSSAVELTGPSITKGENRYDFGDTAGMTFC